MGPNRTSVLSDGQGNFTTHSLSGTPGCDDGTWKRSTRTLSGGLVTPGGLTVSFDGPQTRLGREFGCNSGYPEPRDSWNRGRRHRDCCSLQTGKVYGDPIPDAGVTIPHLSEIRGVDDV